MNHQHRNQHGHTSASSPAQYPSEQFSSHTVLDIDKYLGIIDRDAGGNSQTYPYQGDGSRMLHRQGHHNILNQAATPFQEYHSSVHNQGSPNIPDQPARLQHGYYLGAESPPYPSRLGAPFPEAYHQSETVYPANYQPQTPRSNTGSTPQSKDGHPRSKRAVRRAKIAEEHGSVGATDTPKGETRQRNGVTEWYDPALEIWRLAAPLDDYRRLIINEDNGRDSYAYLPDHGLGDGDITTFPVTDGLGQKYWHFHNRSSFEHILDAGGNQVMYLLKRPKTNFEIPNPDYMMYDGVIMLDPDDWPILDWPGLPRCISSQIEGWRIEALRRVFPWLALPHFRARMPRQVLKKSVGIKPLFGLSSLTQRVSRFRESNDIPPWKKVHVSKGTDLTKHTLARLSGEGLELNSTARLEHPPRREVLQRKEVNNGRFPENVGLYTLTEQQRKEKEGREARRFEEWNLRQQRDNAETQGNSPAGGNKRRRDDSEATDFGEYHSAKRQQTPSGSAVRRTPRPSTLDPSEETGLSSSPTTNAAHAPRFQHVARKAPPNSAAPRTETNEGGEGQDLRYLSPRSICEQVSIKAALSYTRDDFTFFHGIQPPPTTNTASYLTQYEEIQSYHHSTWFDPASIPQLLGLSSWYGSFNAVPLPDVEVRYMQRLLPDFYEFTPSISDVDTPQSNDSSHSVSDGVIAGSSDPPTVPPPTPADGEGGSGGPPRIPTPSLEDLYGGTEIDWSKFEDIDFSELDESP